MRQYNNHKYFIDDAIIKVCDNPPTNQPSKSSRWWIKDEGYNSKIIYVNNYPLIHWYTVFRKIRYSYINYNLFFSNDFYRLIESKKSLNFNYYMCFTVNTLSFIVLGGIDFNKYILGWKIYIVLISSFFNHKGKPFFGRK